MKKLTSILLCAGMICSTALCGCTVKETYLNGNSSSASTESNAESTTESKASEPEDGSLPLPEDGGFKTVDYKLTERSDKYRTFYEIFPYSFCDSNGDGIGDFNGIRQQLIIFLTLELEVSGFFQFTLHHLITVMMLMIIMM